MTTDQRRSQRLQPHRFGEASPVRTLRPTTGREQLSRGASREDPAGTWTSTTASSWEQVTTARSPTPTSRAGLKILSIDRGQHAGGGLQTAEDSGLPGFLHTTHTFSSRGLSTSPWFQEPGLHRWGVTMIAPDPAIASLQRDGRALCWHDDLDRAVASSAQFSRADAGTWRRIASDYAALIRDLIGPEQASPLIAGRTGAAAARARPHGTRVPATARAQPAPVHRDDLRTPLGAGDAPVLLHHPRGRRQRDRPGAGHPLLHRHTASRRDRPGRLLCARPRAQARDLRPRQAHHGADNPASHPRAERAHRRRRARRRASDPRPRVRGQQPQPAADLPRAPRPAGGRGRHANHGAGIQVPGRGPDLRGQRGAAQRPRLSRLRVGPRGRHRPADVPRAGGPGRGPAALRGRPAGTAGRSDHADRRLPDGA
jgi:hypothetical protein